jgi:hypothetical protein
MINVLPGVVDIVVVSCLIKVATRTALIMKPKRRAVIRQTSTHVHRRIIPLARLFEIIFR